jgi:hypothetical protein
MKKIEHHLFSYITINWRGEPLRSYRTIVQLIAATTTDAGLQVRAELDENKYPKGSRFPMRRSPPSICPAIRSTATGTTRFHQPEKILAKETLPKKH